MYWEIESSMSVSRREYERMIVRANVIKVIPKMCICQSTLIIDGLSNVVEEAHNKIIFYFR